MGAGRCINCLVNLWTKPQVTSGRTESDMEPGPLVAFFSDYYQPYVVPPDFWLYEKAKYPNIYLAYILSLTTL